MEGNILCSLCYEIFVYPVTLPCNHRFCKLCLDKHFDNNGFTCPLCRTRVSNWLRKLRLNDANLVDARFWKLIKTSYPTEIEARLSGSTDVQLLPIESGEIDEVELKIVIVNELKKEFITNEHAQYKAFYNDHIEPWRGWPDNISTVCRDVACQVSEQISAYRISANEKPKKNISKPGEIRKEYEEFLRKQQEESFKEEEKNLRLSKELIAMLEEDETRENEKLLEQLRADEELARRLEGESRSKKAEDTRKNSTTPNRRKSRNSKPAQSGKSVSEDILDSSQKSLKSFMKDRDSLTVLRPGSPPSKVKKKTISQPSCSTPQPAKSCVFDNTTTDISPIPLDTPSTSKDDIFSKNFKRTIAHGISRNSSHEISSETATTTVKSESKPVPSTFSIPELSHFASVIPRPSTSINEPTEVQSSTSRSSSGSDSIGQELRHFKPIRTSPTTPTKEGNSSWMPQVVVAQRGIATLATSSEVIQVICDDPESDISAQDIEDSIALEKQIQADHELAAMLQKEWDSAENKRKRNGLFLKTDYNLRNKKKKSTLRKKNQYPFSTSVFLISNNGYRRTSFLQTSKYTKATIA